MIRRRLIPALLAFTALSAPAYAFNAGDIVTYADSSGGKVQSNVSVVPVFNNSQMNEYALSALNGISVSTEFHNVYSFYATEALTGAMAVPNSATVGQANAVSGIITNASTTTNAVGIFGMAKSAASGTHNWAANFIAIDNGHASTMLGIEVDGNISSASSVYNAISVDGATGVQPAVAGGFNCGFLDTPVAPGSLAKWTGCFNSNDGVASTFASVGALATSGASVGSQPINWSYRTAGNVEAAYVTSVFGGLQFNIATTAGAGLAFLNVDGKYVAGGTVGTTATCSVAPTGITIKGGIVTAVSGGTCS